MDKEDAVHTYNGMLLIIWKKTELFVEMWMELEVVIQSEVSQRKYSINAYMWNLEKWYRWSYLQSRNRDTEVETKYMDTKRGKGREEDLGDWYWHIYIIDIMYKIDN